jgi:hypothetical protein
VITMKTNTRPALFSMLMVLLAGVAAGCGVSVEADVPEVVVTQRDLAFDGVPLAGLIGDVSITRSFSQEHKKLELPDQLDSHVTALGVVLTAKSGITDFSFIHNLRVTMSDEIHDPIELAAYQQDPSAAPSGVLSMKSANPVNTLEAWKTNSATFTVEVAGTLPPQGWSVDLAIHFAGTIKYTY